VRQDDVMRVSDGRHVDSDIGYRTTGLTEYGSDDVSIGATEPFDIDDIAGHANLDPVGRSPEWNAP
jgi:hypothetical protein